MLNVDLSSLVRISVTLKF